MQGVFAEFETNLRRERQLEGIALAKTRGVYRGRKHSVEAAEVRRLRLPRYLGSVDNSAVADAGMGPLAEQGTVVLLLEEETREQRQGLKVLFSTGCAESPAIGSGWMEGGTEVITKPFTIETSWRAGCGRCARKALQ